MNDILPTYAPFDNTFAQTAMNSVRIEGDIVEHQQLVGQVLRLLVPAIERMATTCLKAIKNGNKIILFGNGGSAADAQHIAAELCGRFEKDRKALAAMAITTDTSALTAIANDLGFENVFARQVEALAKPGDVLIGISTSGKSPNVSKALETGRNKGCTCLSLTGANNHALASICHQTIAVPHTNTARIQEMHILIGHLICATIEQGI